MKLKPKIVEKVWGRRDLSSVFGCDPAKQIGEVWYDSGEKQLSLLIKYLFTSERLSIQVHPNDAQARGYGLTGGKEECWYILDAEPDARLGIGTVRPLSFEELRESALDGSLEDLIDWKPVSPGDFYYIPAGTVHAIGAGIRLIEVQQNRDVTYRLYDYGRPRELHLDDAVAVADARPYSDPRSGRVSDHGSQTLVDGPYFRLVRCNGEMADVPSDTALYVTPLTGTYEDADGNVAGHGECLHVHGKAQLKPSHDATALVAWELEPSE